MFYKDFKLRKVNDGVTSMRYVKFANNLLSETVASRAKDNVINPNQAI